MKPKKIIIESLGWYGVSAILLAYTLISFLVIEPDSWQYQLLNISGSIGIIVSSLSKRDYQPVVLNVAWLLIAVVALVGVILL